MKKNRPEKILYALDREKERRGGEPNKNEGTPEQIFNNPHLRMWVWTRLIGGKGRMHATLREVRWERKTQSSWEMAMHPGGE